MRGYPMSDVPTPFVHRLRVYWEDTDAGGVVFYANYLKFFERARTEWLRAHGFGQEAMRRDAGLMFIVAHTEVHYRAPARLDDLIDVDVVVRHRGQASLQIVQHAHRVGLDAGDNGLLAEGVIRIGCVDAGTFRPCRIPSPILDCLK